MTTGAQALRFTLRGREYGVPVTELDELIAELDTLAADDSLGAPLVLGCVTTRAIVASALAEQTALPAVELGPNEDLALVTAIANMLGRGTAGPRLEQLRDDLVSPIDGTSR